MRRDRWMFGGVVLLCATGVGAIALFALLGKGGELDGGRLAHDWNFGWSSLGGLALCASPFLVIAALCAWWRRDRWLAAAGRLAAAACLGVTLWGTLDDYLTWSQLPPPADQITYLAQFFAMLGGWAVCLVYGAAGLVVWSLRRWRSQPRGWSGSRRPTHPPLPSNQASGS